MPRTRVPQACCMQAATSDSRASQPLLLLPPTSDCRAVLQPQWSSVAEGDTIDVRGPWGEFRYLGAGRFT